MSAPTGSGLSGTARFVVRRALLRHVLGASMGCAPATVAFVNGAHGKPALAPRDGEAIAFNAAHSRGLAGVAVTRGRAVGLDVERCERAEGVDWAPIVARLGHARERATLEGGEGAVDAARCLRWWTVKEAVLKARGDGLVMDASRVDISPLLQADSGVVEDETRAWQCAVVDVTGDAQIALAVERGRDPRGSQTHPAA